MNNPYKVLGIDSSASDEEVKTAYRNLAKKYHPDNYTNSPLADLAEEKMKEINEAYSTIMKRRQNKKKEPNYDDASYDSYTYSDPIFENVRMKIDEKDYIRAESMLFEIAKYPEKKTAEWYYLMGVIYERRGWYFEAFKMYSNASNMEPNNNIYRSSMNRMQGRNESRNNDDLNTAGRTAGSCCTTLLCADCCCECFGGDLIKCC